jgi:hypothetical protein
MNTFRFWFAYIVAVTIGLYAIMVQHVWSCDRYITIDAIVETDCEYSVYNDGREYVLVEYNDGTCYYQ